MKHEPECQRYLDDVSEKPRPGACIFCLIAREAYQRGQEDAKKPIYELVSSSKHCELPFYDIDHDGTECCIRMKKVRKVLSGEWTVNDPTEDS